MSGMPGQGYQPGTAANPCSQVEISVSCRNLKDKDAFSKSDPLCVLFTYDIKSGRFHEVGRTEMIKDSLNPDFVKKFIMNYYFEESQKLKFEIYDVDSASSALSQHDFLGRMECTLGEIVGCGSGKIEKQLIGVSRGSKIMVRAEEVGSSKEVMSMHLRATGLDKKDFLGKSDPFLIFYKLNDDRSYTPVHKTEVIKNTLNPTWKPFTISLRTLCNGDQSRTIKVECYDWDSDGSHDLIGEFTSTTKDLAKAPAANTMFEFINPHKKAKKRNYKHSGEMMVMSCKIDIVPTFLDYLQGGMEMNFTVAIDFTGSNGNPASPTSLHYYSPHQQNQYAMAIQAVGEIIQDYDTDKQFPVLGFGAKLPDGQVSHEFPCTFNPQNPYCAGIQGILQAYYTALQRVVLYGPTNFSPVINHVARFASAKQDGSNYFVLLIITDGVITDLPHTIESIVRSSSLPMSIIIVGVGTAEFDAMDILDADNQRLSSQGRYAERDIVQFVPFRQFLGHAQTGHAGLSQAALAKSVLAEIPDQVLYYMKKHGIKPKPPRDVPYTGNPSNSGAQPGAVPAMGGHPGAEQQPSYPGGQQQGGVPPYPQTGTGRCPQGGVVPYPHGRASPNPQGGVPQYPQAGAPPYPQSGTSPYQQGTVSPNLQGGAPPYPHGGQNAGLAPYPSGQQGSSAPYPSAPAGGSAPYPSAPVGGSAPYPSSPAGGSAPYPSVPAGSSPYPSAPQSGNAPYPQGSNPGAPSKNAQV